MLFRNDKQWNKTLDLNKSQGETIAERVHRHLRDKSSEITEEDIKRALTVWEIKENKYEDFLALSF